MAELRVLDFGRVSALRSQTLWHATAYGTSAAAAPTLSFMRPDRPYVGLGYHRRASEADLAGCAEAGLPVIRRMVGGGVVYLDEHQQFFQIAVPASSAPRARAAALRRLLAPAVEAFRAVGVPAELDDDAEIVVGDRKVCGHGAAQIDDAVVVVGNLIERFDHEAAARVLALPDDMRAEVTRLMRRYVVATPADAGAFRVAATAAYGRALGLEPVPGELSEYENSRLAELDRRFVSAEFVRGSQGPVLSATPVKIVKVRAGVWVFCADHEQTRAMGSIVSGCLEWARVRDPELNGATAGVEAHLRGLALAEVGPALSGYGAPGRRLAAAFAQVRPTL